jgi:hypothetical protein
MLDSITVAYVKFVTMLIELQKVLSQELKCLSSKTTIVLSEQMVPKTIDESLTLLLYEGDSNENLKSAIKI